MKDDDKLYQERLNAWQKAKFKPPPEPPLNPRNPSSVEFVPMRDSVKLYTEVFLPDRPSAFPVVLIRSPYPYSLPSRNDKYHINIYNQSGYAFVFQITRGQGRSGGQFRYLMDETLDGYDTISWVSKQPWCNGNVGMEGSSYLGITQLLAAKAKPAALKCIMPTAFVGNPVRCFPFSYGVPMKGPYMQWHQVLDAKAKDDMDVTYCDMNALNHPKWGPAFRKRPLIDSANEVLSGDKLASWRSTICAPTDNEFWSSVQFDDNTLAELDLPMFFTDGWYDTTIGPIDFFSRLEKIGTAGGDRFLLVGPWDHYQTAHSSQPGENNGDRTLPGNAAINHIDHRLAFFDRYLRGKTNSVVQKNRVKIYITGAANSDVNRWYNLPTFPAPNTEYQCLYLHSFGNAQSFPGDGFLNHQIQKAEVTDSYVYDPLIPTESIVESSLDRRRTEVRSDVLTYTSKPLCKALTILGDINLVLYAASDTPDTDWFAVLTEVFPDGRSVSFHYAPPAFRARYRDGLDREVFLKPNRPEEFRFSLGSAGHQIAPGNSLRLSIFSSAFPEYDPNSNTGNECAKDIAVRVATQTIFHDSVRPSHLILPVISCLKNFD